MLHRIWQFCKEGSVGIGTQILSLANVIYDLLSSRNG